MDVLSFFMTGAIGCVQIGYAARGARLGKFVACCLLYIGAAEICGVCFPNQMLIGLLWQIGLIYGVSTLVLGLSPGTAAIDALLAVCLTQLGVGVGSSIQSLILPPLFGTSAFEPARAATAALIVASCAGLCILARRLRPAGEDTRFQSALVVPLVFYCVAEICLLELMYKDVPPVRQPDSIHVLLLLLQLLGLFAVFCTLAVSRRALAAIAADRAARTLRHELAVQRTYVEEARLRYNRTRSVRHDMKNHLLVLDGLLQTGRTDEGRAYLARLHAAADMSSLPVRTGNPAVDIILETKFHTAREKGIDAQITGALPPRGEPDDFDLCILFANALDNAIEACSGAPGSRWIRIVCKSRQDLCLLTFENSCAGSAPFREDIGLGNMRSVAEKYHGVLEAKKEREVFTLRILLSISRPDHNSSERFH